MGTTKRQAGSYGNKTKILTTNPNLKPPCMAKQIEELTDEDLMVLWPTIGGEPHLFEDGKDELRHVLTTGECEMEYEFGGKTKSATIGLQLDYYTMAAIVGILQQRGFATPTFNKGGEITNDNP